MIHGQVFDEDRRTSSHRPKKGMGRVAPSTAEPGFVFPGWLFDIAIAIADFEPGGLETV